MVGGQFVSAQIANRILIRRSGTQSITGWQNNAHASGFVLRVRISAVSPVQMGGHELTTLSTVWSHSHAFTFTCAFIVIPTRSCYLFVTVLEMCHERGANDLRSEQSETVPVGLV